jgi:hypothetical protein
MYYKDAYNDGGVRIETVGETRMKMSDESGDLGETSANWDLEYTNDARGRGGVDGEIEATQNGETTRYKLQMDNRDLAQLFSTPHENGMIGERLRRDFAMPRKRRVPQQELMFMREEPQMMDESLSTIMKLMQQGQQQRQDRSRRMKFIYNSGPRLSSRRHRMRPRMKRTRRHRLRTLLPSMKASRKSSSHGKRSFRSNIPLTEIND